MSSVREQCAAAVFIRQLRRQTCLARLHQAPPEGEEKLLRPAPHCPHRATAPRRLTLCQPLRARRIQREQQQKREQCYFVGGVEQRNFNATMAVSGVLL